MQNINMSVQSGSIAISEDSLDSLLAENSSFTTQSSLVSSDTDTDAISSSPIVFNETGQIDPDNFEFVAGQRINVQWIFLKREQCPFVPVHKDKQGKRFQCLSRNCNARVVVRCTCEKSKRSVHIDHGTHSAEYAKMNAIGKIKKNAGMFHYYVVLRLKA